MRPLVSVVIPVYNSEETIDAVLSSITDQSYDHIEIIIVNDGSNDGSESIVKKFIDSHKEININYLFQENKGVSAARNLGLKNAKGDFIAFLDSDDVWDKNKTEIQLAILEENNDIDLLGTNRDGEILKDFFGFKINKITKISPRILLYKNFFMTSSLLFKREIVDEIGYFNEQMNHSEDWEYVVRITDKFNCYLLNESLIESVTGKQRFGDSGLSANLWYMEKGELHSIKLGFKLGFIGFPELLFAWVFSLAKFMRRIIVNILRRIIKN